MLWREKYKIGVPLIDEQHEELFKRVNNFIEIVRSGDSWESKVNSVNETLDFMKMYVVEHFHDEEEYQMKVSYPKFDEHKKVHNSMVNYVLEFSSEYEKSGYDEKLIKQFAGKLLSWLINHVVTEDQNIANYVMKKESERITQTIYTPFFEATRNVFMMMLNFTDVSESTEDKFVPNQALNISIGVIGDLVGEIIYKFPRETSIGMVNVMTGMEIENIDEFVTSAVSEIANIISGNILNMLSKENFICDILPPKLTASEESNSCNIENDIYIKTPVGLTCIEIRLNKNK